MPKCNKCSCLTRTWGTIFELALHNLLPPQLLPVAYYCNWLKSQTQWLKKDAYIKHSLTRPTMMKKETSLSIVSSQICICIGDIVYLPYILYIYVNKCVTSLYCSVFMMAEHCCQACYEESSLIWITFFRLMIGTSNWSRHPQKKTRLTYNCAHLRSTKEILTIEYLRII